MVIIDNIKKISSIRLKNHIDKNIYLKVHNFIMFKTYNIRMELFRRGPSWVRFWSRILKHRFLYESVHGSSFYPYPWSRGVWCSSPCSFQVWQWRNSKQSYALWECHPSWGMGLQIQPHPGYLFLHHSPSFWIKWSTYIKDFVLVR